MFRRLFVGLFLGLLVGGLAAAGFVQGLHVLDFGAGFGGAAFAYLAAAATGVLTGLVAGKPIWAAEAKIEAGLKAFFGALLGAGLLFALRQWGGGLHIPVTAFTPEGHLAGDLPAVALPALAAVLGGFFELDNTPEKDGEGKAGGAAGRKRVASSAGNGKTRVAAEAGEDDDVEAGSVASRRAKR